MRPYSSRIPLALAFFLALSGACGGDDDEGGIPAEYETVPGPNIPQPPAQRSLIAEGEIDVTATTGEASSAVIVTKVASGSIYSGKESGFTLRMACGSTVAAVDVALYFPQGDEIIIVELQNDRWQVDNRSAEVVPARTTSTSTDAGDAGDVDAGDASDAGDAGVTAPPPDPQFVNGLGFPGVDGRREVSVTLVANGVRYDVRATLPWLASNAPVSCQEVKPGTGTKGSSGGGCGSSSGSSRRSSGGDWD